MNRQNIIFVSLLLIAATAIVAVGYATGRGPLAVISGGVSQITSGGQMIPSRSVTEETKGPPAPEISSGQWINSEPLTLMGLHGRVVLIEFWTFACYNCRNALPSIKKWDAQYRDKGLAIIGVHTPELDYESNVDNGGAKSQGWASTTQWLLTTIIRRGKHIKSRHGRHCSC